MYKDYKIDKIIGQELKKTLLIKDIKQQDFSKQIGWNPDNTSQKITGKRGWKAEHIHDMCKVLNISVVFHDEIYFNVLEKEDYPDININAVIGRELHNILVDCNLTQVRLAELTGYSANSINAQIHNKRHLKASQIYEICQRMKVYCIFDGKYAMFYKT